MIHIDEAYVIDTLRELVSIESTNPTLSELGSGEQAIAQAIARLLSELGVTVQLQDAAPGRPNVVGILRGSRNGPSLLLNGHMDTVGLTGMQDPLSGRIEGDKLFGRGSQDMKGSLAAMLGAAKALVDNHVTLHGDLFLAFVADEEALSIGTAKLVTEFKADAAIVAEPTDLTIGRAHRGFIWYEVETFGKAAHGSRYDEGIDANMHMGRVLADLDRLERELRGRLPHPLAGPPSLHASKIQGGSEMSIYADHCLLQFERRTIPGETVSSATTEIEEILRQLSSADSLFKAELKATFNRQPFEIAADSKIVKTVERSARRRLGKPVQHTGQTFWTDAALLAEAGMETVLFGPTGQGLHSVEEWVSISSVLTLAGVLAETAADFCSDDTK